MSEYQEFTGKTVEEALRAARETFGVSGLEELDFEILTSGSRGVLGMGAEPARIIAAPRASLGGTPRRGSSPSAPPPVPPRTEPAGRLGPPPAPGGGTERPRHPAGRSGDRPRGDDRGRPGRGPREVRRATGLSAREADEVATARARTTSDREDIQAVEATPEALAAGQHIVETLIGLMGYRASVTISTGTTAKIDVRGVDDSEREALGALIGRKGERLSALQHLVNLMLSRQMGAWTRVLVDVEDYRGRRERQVTEVARRAAERVLETGTMLQLDPMPALERRWVHLALRDVPGIATQSIGEEPMRRIVVLKV
jgi:spoIIIJ-associated protein